MAWRFDVIVQLLLLDGDVVQQRLSGMVTLVKKRCIALNGLIAYQNCSHTTRRRRFEIFVCCSDFVYCVG